MNEHNQETQDVLHQIAALTPSGADQPQQVRAWARLARRLAARPIPREQIPPRLHLPPGTGLVWAGTVVSAPFSFPTVRAAASDFLGLFRVQKFAAISISPEQIAILQQVAENGAVPGELIIEDEPGELMPVLSIPDAATFAGMDRVRTLVALGEPQDIFVMDGGHGRFIIDVAGARSLVSAAGADPALLPDTLDGAAVDVTTFPGVQQMWADGTALLQTESPVVDYPADLDPVLLGEALLQVLGLSEVEAFRLARQIDWTSTLLLPVPSTLATFSEVNVDDVNGMALTSIDGQGNVSISQKSGMLYLVVGNQTVSDLVALARQDALTSPVG